MPYFRAYHSGRWADGTTDGEAADQQEFIGKVYARNRDHENFEITHVSEITPKLCKECGKALGNLGLIYDECVNSSCSLYCQDQR